MAECLGNINSKEAISLQSIDALDHIFKKEKLSKKLFSNLNDFLNIFFSMIEHVGFPSFFDLVNEIIKLNLFKKNKKQKKY